MNRTEMLEALVDELAADETERALRLRRDLPEVDPRERMLTAYEFTMRVILKKDTLGEALNMVYTLGFKAACRGIVANRMIREE